MTSLLLGVAAFALFFAYDINSFTRKNRAVHCTFGLGALLLAVSVGLDLWDAWQTGLLSGAGDVALLSGGLLMLGALIYCLFFALPFDQTYVRPDGGRRVYDGGAYALCRHPGILCYFAMSALWGAAALPGRMLLNGTVLSVLNLLYAWFQDRVTFPKTFADYEDYRKRVPFLLPTPASVRMAGRTWRRTYTRGDDR